MAIPATIANRYDITGVVGRGGMGVVYKAHDTVIGRDVALKTVGELQGRNALELFYREWRVLANLHHPNIIDIFDIGEFDDDGVAKPFFVMPLLPGMTLEQIIRQPGQRIAAERLAEIVSQTCRGLQAIHDARLVHRDLKPSNIFVMEFDSVKLIDFGVAHLIDSATVTGLKGTAAYMAPEQIQNQESTPASDIFSLGVVCYEALAGTRPFRGEGAEQLFHAIVHDTPTPLHELNPVINQTLSRAIHKALAKHPRHRFASAMEFADVFQKAARGEVVPSLDSSLIRPRIERAARAFEQQNYQLASEILGDLEASGHIDPAIIPLRRQVDTAIRQKSFREQLQRAQTRYEEEEYVLALQSIEAALKVEPENQDAIRLKQSIDAELTARRIAESLASARAAVERYEFKRARQLLVSVTEAAPENADAAALLADMERREQEYHQAREEKEALYRAARKAWQNHEFDAAAAELERILELERVAPDTATGESVNNYGRFLELVRAAQRLSASAERRRSALVDSGEFDRALAACADCIGRYPGHPLIQGLMLDIGDTSEP